MIKILIITWAMLLAGTAFASFDTTTKLNNEQKQEQKAYGGNQSQTAKGGSAYQDQTTEQGNAQNVENKTEVRNFAPAMTPTLVGTDNINASSPFFNAGVSATKKYVILNEEYRMIQLALADGFITKEDAQAKVNVILNSFSQEARRKKLFWIKGTQSICDNTIIAIIPLVCQ